MEICRRLACTLEAMTDEEKLSILNMLKISASNEKRRCYRKRQSIKALMFCSKRSENGMIENLSPDGAFFNTRHVSPQGSEITLSFPILNFEFPVKLKASVVRITPFGMGLKFISSPGLSYRLAKQKLADAMRHIPPET